MLSVNHATLIGAGKLRFRSIFSSLHHTRTTHYLKHLAGLGPPDIHAAGAATLRGFIEALKLREGKQLLGPGFVTGTAAQRIARHGDVSIVATDILNEMLAAARCRISGPKADVHS